MSYINIYLCENHHIADIMERPFLLSHEIGEDKHLGFCHIKGDQLNPKQVEIR